MKKDYYTPTEFAAVLGVHRTAINKRCQNGQIKYKAVGKYYWIPAAELNNWTSRPFDKNKPRTKRLSRKK